MPETLSLYELGERIKITQNPQTTFDCPASKLTQEITAGRQKCQVSGCTYSCNDQGYDESGICKNSDNDDCWFND